MKNTNIVIMGLLLAAGPLYARLDLQKVSTWKKEDTSEWTQAKVDTILKHIDANKSGNDATLRPLYKKIDEWKATQAEAVRRELANKAAVAEAQFRAAREVEKAKTQAKYVDALNNLLQATVAQAENLKKEVAKAEITVKEATTPAEKAEAKTKVEETQKDLAALTTQVKIDQEQLKKLLEEAPKLITKTDTTVKEPSVLTAKEQAAKDAEDTLNKIEKALKESGPNSGMQDYFREILDNKNLPSATRTRAKNLLAEYLKKQTAADKEKAEIAAEGTKKGLDSLEKELNEKGPSSEMLPFLEKVIKGEIPTTEALTLRAQQLSTRISNIQKDEAKVSPIAEKVMKEESLTEGDITALQEFAKKHPYAQRKVTELLARNDQTNNNTMKMIDALAKKVEDKIPLTQTERKAFESYASNNPADAAKVNEYLAKDEQNKKEKVTADKAAKDKAADEAKTQALLNQEIAENEKFVADLESLMQELREKGTTSKTLDTLSFKVGDNIRQAYSWFYRYIEDLKGTTKIKDKGTFQKEGIATVQGINNKAVSANLKKQVDKISSLDRELFSRIIKSIETATANINTQGELTTAQRTDLELFKSHHEAPILLLDADTALIKIKDASQSNTEKERAERTLDDLVKKAETLEKNVQSEKQKELYRNIAVAIKKARGETVLPEKPVQQELQDKALVDAKAIIPSVINKIAARNDLSTKIGGDVPTLTAVEKTNLAARLLLKGYEIIKAYRSAAKQDKQDALDEFNRPISDARNAYTAATTEDDAQLYYDILNALEKAKDPDYKPQPFEFAKKK